MAKLGIELQIDVSKIRKERIYQGKKGKYLTMTVFVDPDNKDQYGNNGMITHKKDEGEDRAPILGNCKVFWTDGQQQAQQNYQPQRPTNPNQPQSGNYTQSPQPQQNQPAEQQPQNQQVHNGHNTNYNNQPKQPAPPVGGFDDFDDDIPF